MKRILVAIGAFTAILAIACQNNTTSKEPDPVFSPKDNNIVKSTVKDSSGTPLDMTFDNGKSTVIIELRGESAELSQERAASGIWYKNDHYELRGKGEDLTLTKDGQVIFRSIATQDTDSSKKALAFHLVRNYFFKNNHQSLPDPKIESETTFQEYFGPAATMGKEGAPTKIDFSNQYVIAVVLPETDTAIKVFPVRLEKGSGDEIVLSYQKVVGQKQSFRTVPQCLIVVSKRNTGKVVLNEL
ncbi:MliC family protein [Flavihumibacter petaseus]|uniref:C-type lysozyme inhibitor domain-containing protein n=1 Tax=Flavihumibacter petaseus NBRC 106054 TaxID=1220578 RepID=A0A0E9MYX9_9BACT|nr:MliC family protein [Flavihumibacter petaseus]GAO42738.1 hypothetical protein FPE01S_01_17560 [Flavihumibacter petaseus NBRC 106054]